MPNKDIILSESKLKNSENSKEKKEEEFLIRCSCIFFI